MANNNGSGKSLESWIWDAACSIRGAKDAPKYKDYILPLIFTKRLCDVFDDELNRRAKEVGSRKQAFLRINSGEQPRTPMWQKIDNEATKKSGKFVATHFVAFTDIGKEMAEEELKIARALREKVVSNIGYTHRPQHSNES